MGRTRSIGTIARAASRPASSSTTSWSMDRPSTCCASTPHPSRTCSRKERWSMLASKTVPELLDGFSAPTPTPGGGSAAALAGAIAASLLAMVAAMPKTKNGTPEDRAALDAVHPEILPLRAELVGLIDRDAASYDGVVAAYRLPKGTDDEKAARKAAVATAMKHATE